MITALKTDASHFLFVDSDMSWPRDALHRLMDADKDIVGTNAVIRRSPYRSTVVKDGALIGKSSGLVSVDRVGAGLLLIKRHVFEVLPKPWFYNEWLPELEDVGGEDYYFCNKARSHGFSIWVDADIEMIHWGEFGLRMSETGFEVVPPF